MKYRVSLIVDIENEEMRPEEAAIDASNAMADILNGTDDAIFFVDVFNEDGEIEVTHEVTVGFSDTSITATRYVS